MNTHRSQSPLNSRGTALSPTNRFERIALVLEPEEGADDATRPWSTEFFVDQSQSIISENNSPDLSFRFSLNPYRGCEHGCAYCYARPTHEYLGLNAGLDFETKILVKTAAPQLLRAALARPSWQGEKIVFSGVTDCYQPAERKFRLTRGCLEVLLASQHAVGIITKNALIERDLDLLGPLAERQLVRVYLSVTTLDPDLARRLEPRTSTPAAKLRAIRSLSEAGVPVGVSVSPVIPGLTDHEIPAILAAVKEQGALAAGMSVLKLPGAVSDIFLEWLQTHAPLQADRVINRIRGMRGGELNDSRWGKRLTGEGEYAEQIWQTFRTFAAKLGLEGPLPPLDCSRFVRPSGDPAQRRLFE